MSNKEAIVGLDIGTNSIHGLMALYNDETNKLEVVSAETVQSEGIKDGAISGISEAANSIDTLLSRLKRDREESITYLVVAIRGNTVDVLANRAENVLNENESEIDETILDELKEAVKLNSARSIKENCEIIQIIPREYILDGQKGIYNPLGMTCKYFEMQALLVVVPKSNVQNITKVISEGSDNLTYGYAAIGNELVQKVDKEFGCVLIDIGGMNTGIVVYKENQISTAFELPIGSDLITREIYKKLRVATQKAAKEIKEKYGSVFCDNESESFQYEKNGGKEESLLLKELSDIIKLHVDAQIEYIIKVMEKRNINIEVLSGGIVLTGGGSKLKGIVEAFEQAFGCIVKTANFSEDEVEMSKDLLDSQVYTTAISVIRQEIKSGNLVVNTPKKKKKGFSLKEKIKRFFDDVK